MNKIKLEEAKIAVLVVLNRAHNGQIRGGLNNLVRVYFKETQGCIPDNSDEMTQEAIDSLLDEGKLKEMKDQFGPNAIIRAEFLSE